MITFIRIEDNQKKALLDVIVAESLGYRFVLHELNEDTPKYIPLINEVSGFDLDIVEPDSNQGYLVGEWVTGQKW